MIKDVSMILVHTPAHARVDMTYRMTGTRVLTSTSVKQTHTHALADASTQSGLITVSVTMDTSWTLTTPRVLMLTSAAFRTARSSQTRHVTTAAPTQMVASGARVNLGTHYTPTAHHVLIPTSVLQLQPIRRVSTTVTT